MVFPFEFTYFADVLPDFLRFLVQWISNDIARVLMVPIIIVNLVLTVYATILHVFVRKAREKSIKLNNTQLISAILGFQFFLSILKYLAKSKSSSLIKVSMICFFMFSSGSFFECILVFDHTLNFVSVYTI